MGKVGGSYHSTIVFGNLKTIVLERGTEMTLMMGGEMDKLSSEVYCVRSRFYNIPSDKSLKILAKGYKF